MPAGSCDLDSHIQYNERNIKSLEEKIKERKKLLEEYKKDLMEHQKDLNANMETRIELNEDYELLKSCLTDTEKLICLKKIAQYDAEIDEGIKKVEISGLYIMMVRNSLIQIRSELERVSGYLDSLKSVTLAISSPHTFYP